jgi:hypothetical protein
MKARRPRYKPFSGTPTKARRSPSPADAICSSARDVDEALALWRLRWVRTVRDVRDILGPSPLIGELLRAMPPLRNRYPNPLAQHATPEGS